MNWIAYAKEQANEQPLGKYGARPFGGATAGLAAGYEDTAKDIDFLILDCPVSSMEYMIEQEMKSMDTGIPVSYMTWCGNIVKQAETGIFVQGCRL